MTSSNNPFPRNLAAAVALVLGTAAAQAQDVYLEAREYLPTSGALAGIPMWGYAQCTASFADCSAPATSPGPVITVAAGDGLTIHLRNALPDPTSIHLVGQRNAPLPVNADPLRDAGGRLRAFVAEVAPGATGSYTWSAGELRPGTYLYQSGSHVQLQVQMGLYGAVVHDAPNGSCSAAPCAYPSVAYSSSQLMLFSEVDPALHSPATPANLTPAGYRPRILLVNGEARSSVLPALVTGPGTLLRLLNAGLGNHAPQLVGGYFDLVAEDGYVAPVRRSQTALLLAASRTADVMLNAGTYGFMDRMARAGAAGVAPPPGNPVANPDVFYILTNNNPGGNANFPSPGVLANDTDPQGDVLRVKAGSVVPTIPAGATLDVNTTTGLTRGQVQYHAPTVQWVGDASFSYVASEALTASPLDSAPAIGHVVHDQHSTQRLFHNLAGNLNDRWDLIGEVRELPSDTSVTVSFVQNVNNTNCTRVGEVIANIPVPASTTPTTWTYGGLMPNPAGCSRIRMEVAVPEANGVPAHSAVLEMNFQRVNF